MERQREIIIIGAGAAGLLAAVSAAKEGAKVTLLEQNDHVGKKIEVTGNGRCNLTNMDMNVSYYRGDQPEFVRSALKQFGVSDTLEFFHKIGIATVEKNGWVYPRSLQAKSVSYLLEQKARSLKVKIKTREKAEDVFFRDHRWFVKTATWTYEGDAVILANGSKASNIKGSDGSGYELAVKLGHTIITTVPSLVGLKCKGNTWKGWDGVRTKANVRLYVNGSKAEQCEGEVQLTDYGISGIPVFQLSRYAARALQEESKVVIKLDFFPEYSSEQLAQLLEERKNNCPYQSKNDLFIGLLPEKLMKVILKQKDPESSLKNFIVPIAYVCGFDQAQVCAGGVATKEVNPNTMESLLYSNLYFAGELLDVDGPCGGYNLQWAWSSGATAGMHAAKEKP